MSLPPNRVIDALNLPLDERILPAWSTVSGLARVGLRRVDGVAGADIGLWEISPSVSTDVEVDEVFVVLSGKATVHMAAPRGNTLGSKSAALELTAVSVDMKVLIEQMRNIE